MTKFIETRSFLAFTQHCKQTWHLVRVLLCLSRKLIGSFCSPTPCFGPFLNFSTMFLVNEFNLIMARNELLVAYFLFKISIDCS